MRALQWVADADVGLGLGDVDLGLGDVSRGDGLDGQLAAEADADERVSRAEFAAAHISGHGDPATYDQQQVGRIVAAEAEVLDVDGDGYIEPAEYAAMLTAVGIAAETALAGFTRLDTDHDGKVSAAELIAGVAQLFLSQDPADHGTAMLGHA